MSKKIVFALSLFVLLCSSLYVRFNSLQAKCSNGYPVAPDFTLTDIDGNSFSLSGYRGRVVLLDFFYTNCTPSVNQFSELVILHEDFGEKLVIISISPENETVLRDFRDNYNISWTTAKDTANVFEPYEVHAIPTLVIIDQQGYIRYTHVGLTEESLLRPEIESLLPKTIYVDDSNVSGPWNGTKEHPYQNITSGLEHVSDNDTVFVQNGTYYEHVTINKSISLIGENRSTTIIDGNGTGTVVYVTENSVLVKSFTIRNSGNEFNSGVFLNESRSCIVIDNILTNTQYGVLLYLSNSTVVSDNMIANNRYIGILLRFSSNNIVRRNMVINNTQCGICLDSCSSDIIGDNKVVDTKYGIDLHSSSDCMISGNNITNNYCGIVLLRSSNNNKFYHNNFIDNTQQVCIGAGYANFWDNGLEGNYWSNYTGVDLDPFPDGIGDSPHIINEDNEDNCPLMGMFHDFTVEIGYEQFEHVHVISNSTVLNLEGVLYWLTSPNEYFQVGQPFIGLYVTGEEGGVGFCRIMTPRVVLNDSYVVLVWWEFELGAWKLVKIPSTELPISNSTHAYLYFTYIHPLVMHEIMITIPEFPSFLILPLFMIATLLAVIVYRRRKNRSECSII